MIDRKNLTVGDKFMAALMGKEVIPVDEQHLRWYIVKDSKEFISLYPDIESSGPVQGAVCASVDMITDEANIRATSIKKHPKEYERMAARLRNNGRDLILYRHVPSSSSDYLKATLIVHKRKIPVEERIKAALIDGSESISLNEQEITNELHE